VPRHNYRIGVPQAGAWEILSNSDDITWGGSGAMTHLRVESVSCHDMPASVVLTIPPLGTVYLAPKK
jgi:1,4-alpha-glucan branching enzyme